jgi:polyisoprenoid-binding protein YceI
MTVSTATAVPTGTFSVDPAHSRVEFAVKHLGIATVRGHFGSFAGTLELSDDLSSGRAYGSVEVASVDTQESQRDQHLRSPDFFDVENHPEIRFASTGIEPEDEGFKLVGDLTIRGITKPVQLDVRVEGTGVGPDGSERVAFSAEGVIDRNDYGMTWNADLGNGNTALGGEVRLLLAAEVVRK